MKKSLAIVLIAAMLLSFTLAFTAFGADTGAEFTMQAEKDPGNDKTISVTVGINMPEEFDGTVGGAFTLSYTTEPAGLISYDSYKLGSLFDNAQGAVFECNDTEKTEKLLTAFAFADPVKVSNDIATFKFNYQGDGTVTFTLSVSEFIGADTIKQLDAGVAAPVTLQLGEVVEPSNNPSLTNEPTDKPSESPSTSGEPVVTTQPPAESDEPLLLGDVNDNGQVDAGDATIVLRSLVGVIELTDRQAKVADVNDNGQTDAGDATLILRITVGLVK